jgi:hypothetical protein
MREGFDACQSPCSYRKSRGLDFGRFCSAPLPDDALKIVMRGEDKEDKVAA